MSYVNCQLINKGILTHEAGSANLLNMTINIQNSATNENWVHSVINGAIPANNTILNRLSCLVILTDLLTQQGYSPFCEDMDNHMISSENNIDKCRNIWFILLSFVLYTSFFEVYIIHKPDVNSQLKKDSIYINV